IRQDESWMEEEGYVEIGEEVRLTRKGFLVCDDLTLNIIRRLERHMGSVWEQSDIPDDGSDVVALDINLSSTVSSS
ncbi:MAG: hypothetical protein ACKOAG_03060, partial [Candidatus Kapaibacterium sp.]